MPALVLALVTLAVVRHFAAVDVLVYVVDVILDGLKSLDGCLVAINYFAGALDGPPLSHFNFLAFFGDAFNALAAGEGQFGEEEEHYNESNDNEYYPQDVDSFSIFYGLRIIHQDFTDRY